MAQGPRTAPGDLELVRSLVNTRDVEGGSDEIASAPALSEWLHAQGLLPDGVEAGEGDPARVGALREALRELLLRNNDGGRLDPSAPAVLDEAAAQVGLRLRVGADGRTWLEALGSGVDGAVGRVLIAAYRAMENGTWPRLKVCRNDACRWAFYDNSKNRSGQWCAMAACGNKLKAREYRSRRRTRGEVADEGP